MKKSKLSIRIKACELAAEVLAGRAGDGATPAPLVWSLAVFFESYIYNGAEGTRKAFGPKKPRRLKVVRNG